MCGSTDEIEGPPLSGRPVFRRTSIYCGVPGLLHSGIAGTCTCDRAAAARKLSADQELKMILLLEYLGCSGLQKSPMTARASSPTVS